MKTWKVKFYYMDGTMNELQVKSVYQVNVESIALAMIKQYKGIKAISIWYRNKQKYIVMNE